MIINSKAEQEFVKEYNKNGESWIGLQYIWIKEIRTYGWSWVDGSPLTQTYWGTGWPNAYNYYKYGTCCNNEGKWTNTYYDYKRSWICEK